MICKTCKTKIHYCSSCDYDNYLSLGYCSKDCYEESDTFKLFSNKLESFINSLDDIQKSDFFSLWDNGILEDNEYDEVIDNLYKGCKDET
jgi:hypothetical protein